MVLFIAVLQGVTTLIFLFCIKEEEDYREKL